MMMALAWYDWVGLLGTAMILGSFVLLQAEKLAGNGLAYQLLNLFGAVGILLSLLGGFNVSVFLLQLAFIVAFGVLRGHSDPAQPADTPVEITCGAAALRLDPDGRITLRGMRLDIATDGPFRLRSSRIDLN